MKKKLQNNFYLIILAGILTLNSCEISSTASVQIPAMLDSLSTTSFDSIDVIIKKKVEAYGNENVLLVLDIDNTILTSNTDLGGDFWYQWQGGKLETLPTEEQKVAHLFDVIPLLYELGTMTLTEDNLPQLISSWQDDSIKFICLTARSSKARTATERELHRNSVFPERYALSVDYNGYPVSYRHTFTTSDSTSREMTYSKGIAMVEGMNKGELLLHVLELTNSDFEAIVFVDDSDKNYRNVKNAFRDNDTIQMTAIHYTKIEDERKAANGGLVVTKDQANQMHKDWLSIKDEINSVYPGRIK